MTAGAPRILTPLVFLFLFALFLFLSHPALSPFRDAGDLASAAHTLGVAHPPGYPLYVLAGRAWETLLPWANPVYRLNVFSAACGAGAVLLVFIIVAGRTGPMPGAASAVLLATHGPWIRQSGLSEIYTLNALLTFMVAAAALRARDAVLGKTPFWVLAFFLWGLGLGNHHSLILAGPALFFLLWQDRRALPWPALAASFLAGLSIYVFLPLRSGAEHLWGEPGTWKGFWELLRRADYGSGTLSTRFSSATGGEGSLFWLASWAKSWGAPAVLFTAAAVVSTWRVFPAPVKSLTLLWVASGPLFGVMARLAPSPLSSAILEPTLLVPTAAAAALAGFLLAHLRRPWDMTAAVALAAGLMGAGPFWMAQNQRDNLLAHDYGRQLMASVPVGSTLSMISDAAVFSTMAQQGIFKKRQDVACLVDADLPWRWTQYRRKFPGLFDPGQVDGGLALARVPGRTLFTEGMQAKLLDALCPLGLAAQVDWPRRSAGSVETMAASVWRWGLFIRRPPSPRVVERDYYSSFLLRTVSGHAFNTGLLLKEAGRPAPAAVCDAWALFWNPDRRAKGNGL